MFIGCERCGRVVGESKQYFTSTTQLRITHTDYDMLTGKGIVYFLCQKCYTNDDLDEMNQKKKDKLLDLQFQELMKYENKIL